QPQQHREKPILRPHRALPSRPLPALFLINPHHASPWLSWPVRRLSLPTGLFTGTFARIGLFNFHLRKCLKIRSVHNESGE
ncbi:MAG: hypothetical protein ACKOA0_02410, partial [Burkholderiaceae bacterium]